MYRWKFAVSLLALSLSVLGWVAWREPSGTISYRSYERIEKGMEIEQVRALLGAPGEEFSFDRIPGVPPHAKLPVAPDGWLGVVWGERCYRWEESGRGAGGDRTIYVGVSGGQVASKYLLEYSF